MTTPSDYNYAEKTFFHIPQDAVRATSWKVKSFWLICVTSFTVYVTYTSLDIVITYFSQKTSIEVEHEKMTFVPPLTIYVLASWDVDGVGCLDVGNGRMENFELYRHTAVEPKWLVDEDKLIDNPELEGVPKCSKKLQNPGVLAKDYGNLVFSLMGRAEAHWVHVEDWFYSGSKVNFDPVKPEKLVQAGMSPKYKFILSTNLSLHGDMIRSKTDLRISCNWTQFVYAVKPPVVQMGIKIQGDTKPHYVQFFPDTPTTYNVIVQATKARRAGDCTEKTYDRILTESICLNAIVEERYNCCLCAMVPENCSKPGMFCCQRQRFMKRTFFPELKAKYENCTRKKYKRPCSRLQTHWTADPTPIRRNRKVPDNGNFCSGDQQFMDFTIGVATNQESICYNEVYQISMANVFSSIGGVLGFFLGGSIISIIQCGVIGYKQISTCVSKTGWCPDWWKKDPTETALLRKKEAANESSNFR